MKKLHLRNIIKEVLLEEKGYSRYAPGGTTKGLTKDTLDKILLRIANGDIEVTEDEDQVARGNKVLDRADPENVARIIRGEKPVYGGEVDRMQELAGIQSEIRVNQPQLKKFNDYMHILDFFGGELPQSYKQAQAEALRSGYDLTLQEYTVADQNSTFSEIKVNSPGKIQFDYDEDDDDGELKVVSLSKDGETWWGTEPYVDEPGFIKMEFLFEEEEDREVEQEQMDKLTSLLDKHNIPYEITGDDELKFIKIPKDKLDLR